MTSIEKTAAPTDAERATANQVAQRWNDDVYLNLDDAIAQALADQRAAIHAQYAAVADELDAEAARPTGQPLIANALDFAAERIRQVGQQ